LGRGKAAAVDHSIPLDGAEKRCTRFSHESDRTPQIGVGLSDNARARIAELEAELARARKEAMTDPLTGCINRRGWDRLLAAEDDRCTRHGLDAIVVALDLDGFKAVNDRGGHEAGDEMLRRCARALRGCVRGHDVIARPGGDEFALLAVHTDASGEPEPLLARLRSMLERDGVRASMAAATRGGSGTLAEAWRAADRDMLVAKRTTRLGRDDAG
jgi:diguanylate cyclase